MFATATYFNTFQIFYTYLLFFIGDDAHPPSNSHRPFSADAEKVMEICMKNGIIIADIEIDHASNVEET